MNEFNCTQQLTKRYGNKCVDKLNLEVKSGEIYGFRAGGRQTTTIRMLCGLLDASEGEAYLWLQYRGEAALAKGMMAYVPDQPKIYGKLTARVLSWLQLYTACRKSCPGKGSTVMAMFGRQKGR